MPWGGFIPGYKDGGAMSGLHTKELAPATVHAQFGYLRLGCRTPPKKYLVSGINEAVPLRAISPVAAD